MVMGIGCKRVHQPRMSVQKFGSLRRRSCFIRRKIYTYSNCVPPGGPALCEKLIERSANNFDEDFTVATTC